MRYFIVIRRIHFLKIIKMYYIQYYIYFNFI